MTAVQHTPADTDVVDLPTAIRHLEAAEPGALALHPDGGAVCAIKMTKTGMPWLLDPNGHDDGPTHMTTATLARLGYRTAAPLQPKPVDDSPTDVTFAIHIEQLKAAGWTITLLSNATGLDKKAARRALRGEQITETTRRRIMAIDPDQPLTTPPVTANERLDDLEWLLDMGEPAERALRRCGYHESQNARLAAVTAGRHDLAARLGSTADADEKMPVTEAQQPMLAAVATLGECTITQLATAMGLGKQGVRYHLDILTRAGHLSRRAIDGRGTVVYSINEN